MVEELLFVNDLMFSGSAGATMWAYAVINGLTIEHLVTFASSGSLYISLIVHDNWTN